MSKEAMKLALEALFTYEDDWVDDGLGGVHHNVLYDKNKVFKAIAALQEALAEQPAQTVLASAQIVSLNDMQGVVDWLPHNGATLKAGDYLYTSPPAQRTWVGLTDEEILAANYPDGEENGPTISAPDFELDCFAKQVEAKLKEKNT